MVRCAVHVSPVLARVALVGLVGVSSVVPAVAAEAARPGCTRSRVGRSFTGADGRTQRCSRVNEGGRTVYRWVIRVAPAGAPAPSPSSGTTSGASCVSGGWTHDSPLYWETILNAKTLGQAGRVFTFDSAVKTLSFTGPKVLLTGFFEFHFSASDGKILEGYGEYEANAAIEVGSSAFTVQGIGADILKVTLIADGTILPTQTLRDLTLRSGQRIPYSCSSETLRVAETGSGGRPVEVLYQRYVRPA